MSGDAWPTKSGCDPNGAKNEIFRYQGWTGNFDISLKLGPRPFQKCIVLVCRPPNEVRRKFAPLGKDQVQGSFSPLAMVLPSGANYEIFRFKGWTGKFDIILKLVHRPFRKCIVLVCRQPIEVRRRVTYLKRL